MDIEYKVVPAVKVLDFIKANKLEKNPKTLILFAGDRLTCCDEAVMAIVNKQVVGIATIAPDGEKRSGEPAIVGIFVLKSNRGQGVGRGLLEEAVSRMEGRKLKEPYRIDTLSVAAEVVINRLDTEIRDKLKVHKAGTFLDLLPE